MGAGPFPGYAARPPGPVMDRDEADRALARLGAEHEAIETSLLALQDHAGRRLLEGAELTGVTKERWASTEQSITLLWGYFDAYAGRSPGPVRYGPGVAIPTGTICWPSPSCCAARASPWRTRRPAPTLRSTFRPGSPSGSRWRSWSPG